MQYCPLSSCVPWCLIFNVGSTGGQDGNAIDPRQSDAQGNLISVHTKSMQSTSGGGVWKEYGSDGDYSV